jgi:hypothetical protein
MGKTRTSQLVQETEGFARFWSAYPNKKAKGEARKAWAQLNPDDETVQKMLAALKWQARQPTWLKDGGQYIPHPATWLRAERWDDEPTQIPMMNESTVRTMVGAAEFVAAGRKNGGR